MKNLFVTVGLPSREKPLKKKILSEEEAIKERLSNGPEKKAIEQSLHEIDRVYLIATKENKKFAEKIRENCVSGKKECIIIEVNKNNAEKIRKKIENAPELNKKDIAIFEYTAGTKAMIAGVVSAALNFEKPRLVYLDGERGLNGIVYKSKEIPIKTGLVQTKRKILIKKLFEEQKYSACLQILEKKENPKEEMLYQLVEALKAWDLFNHKLAQNKYEEFLANYKKQIKKIEIIKRPEKYSEILKKINNEEEKDKFLILDIYYNALRREKEKKYDDAVGRLYRIIEAIAQLRLIKEYKIKTSEIDLKNPNIKKLDPQTKKLLKNKKVNGKIKIGLRDSYQLLNALKDKHYSKFWEQIKKGETPLQQRNESILAHGFSPIDKKNYDKMKKYAEEIIKEFREEHQLKETIEFPKKINNNLL